MQKLKQKTLKRKIEDWDSSLSAQDMPSASSRLVACIRLARRRLTRKLKGVLNMNPALST